MPPIVIEQTSRLPLPSRVVWDRVTTPAGIRHEIRPLLSMTMPPGLRGRGLDDAGELLNRPLGKAWLLLFGVLPVEYDDMRLVAFEDGRSFHEQSAMLLLSRWEHERTVIPTGPDECEVSDRLTCVPRALGDRAVVRRVVAWIVAALFAHRHRRLAAWAARE